MEHTAETKIEDSCMSMRATNAILGSGGYRGLVLDNGDTVEKIGDLAHFSTSDLLMLPNVGYRTAREIVEIAKSAGVAMCDGSGRGRKMFFDDSELRRYRKVAWKKGFLAGIRAVAKKATDLAAQYKE